MTPQRPHRWAYTLLELLVVLSVLGVLIGLFLSAVQQVRAAAARVACANNARQIGLACQSYESSAGRFPTAVSGPVARRPARVGVPWTVTLLPFIEQESAYRQTLAAYRSTPWAHLNPPHAGLSTVIKLYACPADGRLVAPLTDDMGITAAYKSYVAVSGGERSDGVLWGHGAIRGQQAGVRVSEITDGLSATLLVGERPPLGKYLGGVWYTDLSVPGLTPAAMDANAGSIGLVAYIRQDTQTCRGPFRYGPGRLSNDCDYFHFWSLHPGGTNFVLCDGSVRFLRYEAEPILPALATRAGGEAVGVPD